MPDLIFAVATAQPLPFAAAPTLVFTLDITAVPDPALGPIHGIILRCQIRIEPAQRQYNAPEQAQLLDLYGAPEQWSRTLRPMLWTHASVVVPPFTGRTQVDLPVACSADFALAAAKYFYALQDGHVPLTLLFSGTVFHAGPTGALQIAQVPWEKEAAYRLPVPVWKKLMDQYYPNTAFLCLRRDVFDRLYHYKCRAGLPTWEQAIAGLLQMCEPGVPA